LGSNGSEIKEKSAFKIEKMLAYIRYSSTQTIQQPNGKPKTITTVIEATDKKGKVTGKYTHKEPNKKEEKKAIKGKKNLERLFRKL
jgi:phosphoribosylformylglycinamidine (FGAM) synthase-like amidotransferase family enzyme